MCWWLFDFLQTHSKRYEDHHHLIIKIFETKINHFSCHIPPKKRNASFCQAPVQFKVSLSLSRSQDDPYVIDIFGIISGLTSIKNIFQWAFFEKWLQLQSSQSYILVYPGKKKIIKRAKQSTSTKHKHFKSSQKLQKVYTDKHIR